MGLFKLALQMEIKENKENPCFTNFNTNVKNYKNQKFQ